MSLAVPQQLKSGDKVATVSPSSGTAGLLPWKYEVGKKQLQDAFGVKVVEMPHTLASYDDVYKHPKKRAEDLMAAFSDPDIKGIFACIGGEESMRMLPYIDFDVIKNNPKIFTGYSDSTTIHLMCFKAGVRSYYGPSIMAGYAENGGLFPYMESSARKTLFSNEVIGEVAQNTAGWVVKQYPWDDKSLLHTPRKLNPPMARKCILGSGKVQGHLLGGCMEVLDMLRGTSLWPELDKWQGAIAFFETSEEMPPIDNIIRWLRTYCEMGLIQALAGIVLARPGGDAVGEEYYSAQEEAFLKIIRDEYKLDLPILTRLDFGHTDPQFLIPYGAKAEIDADNKTFTILESGCL